MDIYSYFESLQSAVKQSQRSKECQESEKYLKRLQILISTGGLSSSHAQGRDHSKPTRSPLFSSLPSSSVFSSNFRYTKLVQDMDKDELRGIQQQCHSLLERCGNVLEQVEKSAIEHSYNYQTLLSLALQQRAMLAAPNRDYRHDSYAMMFTTPETAFPSSSFLVPSMERLTKSAQKINSFLEYVKIQSPQASPHSAPSYFYYHPKRKHYQKQEPFDSICKNHFTNLRREKWYVGSASILFLLLINYYLLLICRIR